MFKKLTATGLGCVIAFLCACTPVRVIEVDVRLGTLLDQDIGFYAYTTPLAKKEFTDLKVTCSSKATIEGRLVIKASEEEYAYPMTAYLPGRTYVRPAYLERKTRLKIAESLPPDSFQTLGYFKKSLSKSKFAGIELDQISESNSDGLSWAILEQKNVERTMATVLQFAKYAADYGADAVVDVAVYYVGECPSCRDSGLFVAGTAIVFVE